MKICAPYKHSRGMHSDPIFIFSYFNQRHFNFEGLFAGRRSLIKEPAGRLLTEHLLKTCSKNVLMNFNRLLNNLVVCVLTMHSTAIT